MRPPRIAILVLFLAASLFIFCRSIGLLATASSSHNVASNTVAHSGSAPKPYLSRLFALNAPFTLFPPNAAISLTDDNSTTFAARPAAFGPMLPTLGLSGQLWIGGGFNEDDSPEDGELGCGDSPGWENSPVTSDSYPPTAELGLNGPNINADVKHDQTDRDPNVAAGRVAKGTHIGVRLIQENVDITDKVVLLSRGGCGFVWKVRWAQRRGARAVIISDNQKGGSLIQMFAKGDTSDVYIPSVFTARTTALVLSSLSQPGGMWHGALDGGDRHASASRPPGGHGARCNIENRPVASRSIKRSWVSWLLENNVCNAHRRSGVFSWLFLGGDGATPEADSASTNPNGAPGSPKPSDFISMLFGTSTMAGAAQKQGESNLSSQQADENEAEDDEYTPHYNHHLYIAREGLWVTLAPASSASPFFDTLLVLVISPLITLVVVYALLIIRARIRRRRWRAPKSVIDRLPVRTYHTVAQSPSDTPRVPSPTSSSPSTPLLQQASASFTVASNEPHTDDGNNVDFGDVTASTSGQAADGFPSSSRSNQRTPQSQTATSALSHRDALEKQTGPVSSQWKKYMTRQIECVVCLEEYVDGVSQVMSLPCGHEFHVDCITPWLTTRRRTCPICKGDVVRSLTRGSSAREGGTINEFVDDGDSEDDVEERSALISAPITSDVGLEEDLEHGVYSSIHRRGHRAGRSDGWITVISDSFVTPSRMRGDGGLGDDRILH